MNGHDIVSDMLGFVKMPEGYELCLNCDRTHFYWLRISDEVESVISWDKWAAYRGAKFDKGQCNG